jgi:hypothetical protein
MCFGAKSLRGYREWRIRPNGGKYVTTMGTSTSSDCNVPISWGKRKNILEYFRTGIFLNFRPALGPKNTKKLLRRKNLFSLKWVILGLIKSRIRCPFQK